MRDVYRCSGAYLDFDRPLRSRINQVTSYHRDLNDQCVQDGDGIVREPKRVRSGKLVRSNAQCPNGRRLALNGARKHSHFKQKRKKSSLLNVDERLDRTVTCNHQLQRLEAEIVKSFSLLLEVLHGVVLVYAVGLQITIQLNSCQP